VVGKCFRGTASRVEGVGFAQLASDAMQLHAMGYPPRAMAAVNPKPQTLNPKPLTLDPKPEPYTLNLKP